jgi:hypothetical protein
MAWLCRAQDATGCGGVSGGYYLHRGWMPPYPETTGYIIPTFLQYATRGGDHDCGERAIRMGAWELTIQDASGAVPGGMGVTGRPVVFNTGQVLQGWVALYQQTRRSEFLEAAIRAADWLIAQQDRDGKWSRYEHLETPHVYNARVAWPLAELAGVCGRSAYRDAAERHVVWVLAQTDGNGWMRHAGFGAADAPFTHTIAYTLEGLLGCLPDLAGATRRRTLEVVRTVAEQLLLRYEARKPDPYGMPRFLPGRFDEGWRPVDRSSCLTGDAQLALAWLRLYALEGDARFLNSALKLLDQVKATQSLDERNPAIRRGVAGSYPLWGAYTPIAYPNWAPKFLADALMLQETVMETLERDNMTS